MSTLYTKRHYEHLANVIGGIASVNPVVGIFVTMEFARSLAEDNPRFDEDRFVKAVADAAGLNDDAEEASAEVVTA